MSSHRVATVNAVLRGYLCLSVCLTFCSVSAVLFCRFAVIVVSFSQTVGHMTHDRPLHGLRGSGREKGAK